MTMPKDTISVFIPLAPKRRNGRPRILPPEPSTQFQTRTQDPHILRSLGRAWGWRRKLEGGMASTIQEIADAEKISDRFVSRTMRLAYLSPAVIDRLLFKADVPSISVKDLVIASYLPWAEQMARVFDGEE